MFWPWVQALDHNRVAQLAESFRAGDYGVNIMKKPSLLEFGRQPKIDAQGARLLCDGKHTIAALKELGAELAANDSLAETWTNALVAAIRTGVPVMVVEFADDDPDVVLAFNSLAHDLDSNRYKATSLKDLVDVAKRYKARTPSGEWTRVQKVLVALYGENKRSAHQQ
jgi:hypothetical protein